jgi:hypothetical protein
MNAFTFLGILASEVPAGLAEFRIRHIHHPGAVIPLHTTLLHPFLSLTDFEREGQERLRQLTAGMAPFEYQAGSICAFPTGNALWLAPTPVTPFEQLSQTLYDAFPQLVHEAGYPTYHMTVGLTRSLDQFAQAVQEFQTGFGARLPFRFVCDELAVYTAENEDYRLHSLFPLGGE